jgi:hypothetical protein
MGRRGMSLHRHNVTVLLPECDYDGVSIRPVTVTVESKCNTVQGEAKRPSVGVLRSIVSAIRVTYQPGNHWQRSP